VLIFNVFCIVFALGKLSDQRRKGAFEILHFKRMMPYYGAAIAGNLAMLIVQLFPHEYDYVKASAAPFSVLVSVATARYAPTLLLTAVHNFFSVGLH
jgi:hypothetical protein